MCGTQDHLARNCAKKGNRGNRGNNLTITRPAALGKPTARTINMTVKDTVASKDVVSGIIPVNSIDAYVLFDLGATCSFVSH